MANNKIQEGIDYQNAPLTNKTGLGALQESISNKSLQGLRDDLISMMSDNVAKEIIDLTGGGAIIQTANQIVRDINKVVWAYTGTSATWTDNQGGLTDGNWVRCSNNELAKNTGKIKVYDTIADLQSDTALQDGDIVEVLGYYEKGDRGGHFVKIESTNKGGVLVGSLYANPIALSDGEVLADWYGAKGDDSNNDSVYILKALQYNKCVSLSSNKTYKLENIQLFENNILDCKGAIIKPFSNNPIFFHNNNTEIKNSSFVGTGRDGVNTNEKFIVLNDKKYTNTINIKATECAGTVIEVGACLTYTFEPRNFNNINIDNCTKGVVFSERAEYCNLSSFSINKTTEALTLTAGNINAGSGIITDCTRGLIINSGANDAHGIVGNMEINHCDFPLIINNINVKSMNISNLNIYYGIIHLNECEGIMIQNSELAEVEIREEGAKNCYFKDNNFSSNVVITNNYNSKPSKVIYDNIIDVGSGILGISNLRGGYYHCRNLSNLSLGSIGSGATVQLGAPTKIYNSISKNLDYTLDEFFNATTNTFEIGTKRIIDSWNFNAKVEITIFSTSSFQGKDVEVYFRGPLNEKIIIPVVSEYTVDIYYTKLFQLSATLMKNDYKLHIKNNSAVSVEVSTHDVSNNLYNEIIIFNI